MYVPIWDISTGDDEGFLNLDTLDKFKIEFQGGNPSVYNLVSKKGSVTKVYRISGNSYVRIRQHMAQHEF